jgi:hypothetical protein
VASAARAQAGATGGRRFLAAEERWWADGRLQLRCDALADGPLAGCGGWVSEAAKGRPQLRRELSPPAWRTRDELLADGSALLGTLPEGKGHRAGPEFPKLTQQFDWKSL